MQLRILNTKEKKGVIGELEQAYDVTLDAVKKMEVLYGDREYFAVTRDCLQQDLTGLDVNALGLRLTVQRGVDYEPTIHAIQVFFNDAGKSISLTKNEAKEFIGNHDIKTSALDGKYIVKTAGKAIDLGGVKDNTLRRRR